MTEILEKIEMRMQARAEKRAAAPRYIIDPVAFFVALLGGPLLVTALSFWMLFIPVFALAFGGPFYLLIGTPLLLWHLRRTGGETRDIAALAFFANLMIFPLGAVAAVLTHDKEIFTGAMFIVCFGMIFAPAWAWGFGYLYNRLRRDFYAQPQYI
ncbi:hypothetical protein [uncultured Sulfitobacter sp.]|uniref:hypothetical protein n=1 Tax=uncultured Sulfitobacter sp. TaxID=191468 RepID=UPI002635C4E9|nr:hypothetical protein [uncultured Sulfitobacter sp.]